VVGREGGKITASASVQADDPTCWVITLTGELDIGSVEVVRACFDEVIDRRPARVVVDLAGLSFMDSTGISLLLAAAEKVPLVELRSTPVLIRTVMEAMGLSGVLRFVQ